MTLSNFDWTDKDSVKWFILLPTGHEGPYSLKNLEVLHGQKTLGGEVKVWTEGLENSVSLRVALDRSVDEEIPELPPLPIDDEVPPPLVFEREVEAVEAADGAELKEGLPRKRRLSLPLIFGALGGLSIVLFFVFQGWVSGKERFEFRREARMGLTLFEKIQAENSFDGWDKKIFFKEYLPDDHSHIWLVTTSFQRCNVEASFTSMKGKMLSTTEEMVAFKSKGQLKNHVVEFSSFDFSVGNKIVPGLYEMEVRAMDCVWDGLLPSVMNGFSGPDSDYVARTKVILFSRGPEEFNEILGKLIKMKEELARKEFGYNEIFWQDLQQKFETLQAITLQIEQLMLEFLDVKPKAFSMNLKPMVEKYTRQFGSFLTAFVVENENYFKKINSERKGASQKRNYELLVRLTAKRIGFESMKFIEEFQKVKAPGPEALQSYSERVRKTYAQIKQDIGQKIIQVSEDRSK